MKSKSQVLSFLLLLLNVGAGITTGNTPENSPKCKKEPCVTLTLTNSYSYLREEFGVLDSVFGSFTCLEPDKRYSILVMRSNGNKIPERKILHLHLTSNQNGIIPACALLWDLGVKYDSSGVGKIYTSLLEDKYTCVLKQGKRTILEEPITVLKDKKKKKTVIYPSDEQGNPKKIFIKEKEDVYLTGKNFNPSNNGKTGLTRLYIYVAKDRYSWQTGDRLESYFVKKYVIELLSNQHDYKQLIWNRDDGMEAGSYDIIVTHNPYGILFESNDLIKSNYGVGFKVIDSRCEKNPKKEPIIMDLACQEPPQFRQTGTLADPYRPVYKDYFAPEEEIWVAVNPPNLSYSDKTARIYVTEHRQEWVDEAPLKASCDVSGGYEEILLQPLCTYVFYTRVWSNPEVDPGNDKREYDVVVDFKPFGIYNKGRDILDTGEKGGFYVPKQWVCLETVSFNHHKTSICLDAITIRRSINVNVRVPEWKRGCLPYRAAYIAGIRIALKPEFTAAEGVSSAYIKGRTCSGNLANLKKMKVLFDKGQSYLCYFEPHKAAPDRIQSFYQEWEWYLCGLNNIRKKEIHIATTLNKIYIVFAVPQHPWTTWSLCPDGKTTPGTTASPCPDGKTTPWTKVLDLSTQIAFNAAEPEAAAGKITRFLYKAVGASYEKNAHQYSPTNGDSSVSADFKLKSFLKNIPHVGKVNCYDMAKALVIFSNALGCGLGLRYCRSFGDLNWVQLVGKNDWDYELHFNNHAFAALDDRVFDASIKVSTWSNPDKLPHLADWLINIPWDRYKKMVVKKESKTQPDFPQMVIFKIKDESK